MTYDYIIVGGGPAGCVLANRLSARSAVRVLLCEAGPDLDPERVPAEVADSYPGAVYGDPRYHWEGLLASTSATADAASGPPVHRKYIQPRILGGGSSINGQLANRGAPADYEEWVQLGATGWGWEAVLPYFRKLETDLDFGGPLHGACGPIRVRRLPESHWCGHAAAAARAFRDAGFPFLQDQNGAFEEGYFSIAISNADERRVSAATAYLDRRTRSRPNLTVLTGAEVRRLLMQGRRCTGVEVAIGHELKTFTAGEVILSAGAIFSPAHLLRAGIGPAEPLRRLGIAVVADRAGVGRRLMDHPSVALGALLKPGVRLGAHSPTRRHMQVGLRYSSGIGPTPLDMFLGVVSKTAWHAVGEQMGAFAVMSNRTYSEAGVVRLRSADPAERPLVDFNLLADARDLERLKDGFLRAVRLATSPPLRAVFAEIFPASYSERVVQFGQITTRNRLAMAAVRRLLDGPAPLRRWLMDKAVIGEFTLADVLAHESRLEAFIRATAVGAWHPSCSCRMGSADDPMAVVAPSGRVHGTDGLRVVDASIFPQVPRANTNLPTMMVAEKISDDILAEHGRPLPRASAAASLT